MNDKLKYTIFIVVITVLISVLALSALSTDAEAVDGQIQINTPEESGAWGYSEQLDTDYFTYSFTFGDIDLEERSDVYIRGQVYTHAITLDDELDRITSDTRTFNDIGQENLLKESRIYALEDKRSGLSESQAIASSREAVDTRISEMYELPLNNYQRSVVGAGGLCDMERAHTHVGELDDDTIHFNEDVTEWMPIFLDGLNVDSDASEPFGVMTCNIDAIEAENTNLEGDVEFNVSEDLENYENITAYEYELPNGTEKTIHTPAVAYISDDNQDTDDNATEVSVVPLTVDSTPSDFEDFQEDEDEFEPSLQVVDANEPTIVTSPIKWGEGSRMDVITNELDDGADDAKTAMGDVGEGYVHEIYEQDVDASRILQKWGGVDLDGAEDIESGWTNILMAENLDGPDPNYVYTIEAGNDSYVGQLYTSWEPPTTDEEDEPVWVAGHEYSIRDGNAEAEIEVREEQFVGEDIGSYSFISNVDDDVVYTSSYALDYNTLQNKSDYDGNSIGDNVKNGLSDGYFTTITDRSRELNVYDIDTDEVVYNARQTAPTGTSTSNYRIAAVNNETVVRDADGNMGGSLRAIDIASNETLWDYDYEDSDDESVDKLDIGTGTDVAVAGFDDEIWFVKDGETIHTETASSDVDVVKSFRDEAIVVTDDTVKYYSDVEAESNADVVYESETDVVDATIYGDILYVVDDDAQVKTIDLNADEIDSNVVYEYGLGYDLESIHVDDGNLYVDTIDNDDNQYISKLDTNTPESGFTYVYTLDDRELIDLRNNFEIIDVRDSSGQDITDSEIVHESTEIETESPTESGLVEEMETAQNRTDNRIEEVETANDGFNTDLSFDDILDTADTEDAIIGFGIIMLILALATGVVSTVVRLNPLT